jgi:hypothetical protein
MGMGYGANFDVVISEADVKKICIREWNRLDDIIDEYSSSWNDVGIAVQYADEVNGVSKEGSDAIWNAIEDLQRAFKERTGISLDICHHDSSGEGSRYDDVDGQFFVLNWNDCFKPSPEYQQLKERGINVDIKYWVTYG